MPQGKIRVTKKVAGAGQRERSFPANTPKRIITAWKKGCEDQLRKRRPASARKNAAAHGTVAADIERVIPQRKELTSWKDYRTNLRHWIPAIGKLNRSAVTKEHVRLQVGKWIDAGVAARSINNRVSALNKMYELLDGEDAPTPCGGVWIKPPKGAKQPVQIWIVNKVCAELLRRHEAWQQWKQDGGARTTRGRPGGEHALKDRARLMVMSSCSKRPAEIGRADPNDLDLTALDLEGLPCPMWYDRAAKGGDSPGLPLNSEMLIAWEEFIAADAWGDFSKDGHFARRLRDAGWPKGLKPYNVRHGALQAASERGGDLADIQVVAGHLHLSTTRGNYVPVFHSRMRKLTALMDKRHGWTRRLPKAGPPGHACDQWRDASGNCTVCQQEECAS